VISPDAQRVCQGLRVFGENSSPRQFGEAIEHPDAGGVAHFAVGVGHNLTDALAGDLELAAGSTTRK
jgi:hypothetical protein